MNLFYQPKHVKPNPIIIRLKNSYKWIWGEVKWYFCFWKKLFLKIGELIIEGGIHLIDFIDYLKDDLEIKTSFEKIKKFCYNIYIKLRNKNKDIRMIS